MQIKNNIFILFLWIGLLKIGAQPFIGEPKVYYGASYYPEAWDLKGIDNDIKQMKELNMNVMRMAEFSWAWFEPTEGEFKFEWLKNVVEKLHANGIDVIIGTPTATPPAWMAEKYPEIFRINADGSQETHGARRNCSYTSAKYRELSVRVTDKMAQEFGKMPGVIGWQTDNEFNHAPDYSSETKAKWHQWLTFRYKTIDSLNKIWCTWLWSQQYNSFQQIPMPVPNANHHPSLLYAWARFTNDMIVEFQDLQVDVIRKHSKLPITHDGMPGQSVDYEKLFKNLDFMSVNNYHSFEAYDRIQSNYDRMRGYGMGYHWLFETAPNNSGGGDKGNTWFLHQPDGSMRAAIWMNHALGAQGTMFWLWKQHWAGQEMPHGAIISAWGKPSSNYNDLVNLGKELNATSKFQMETPVEPAKAAIVWCHENLNGLKIEEMVNGLNYYTDWTYRFYRPIADAYIHRDVISQSVDLSPYKILFIPLLPSITVDFKNRIETWVENGGILIMGPMSGYRSEEWTAFTNHAYGDFGKWTGVEVEGRIPIGLSRRSAEVPLMLIDESNQTVASEATLWSESLSSKNGKTLYRYSNGMHKNLPAIIENKVGKGKVVVFGTDPGKEIYSKLALAYAKEAGVTPIATGDKGVVIAPRKGMKSSGYVIVNIANEPKNIQISGVKGSKNILTNQTIENENIALKPYDVLVIEIK